MASSSAFPILTGRDFDKSLRNGQAEGRIAYPKFGRLLAATQTDGPQQITVDLTGVTTSVIGIFACKGPASGPAFGLKDGSKSLLWFKSDGCDETNLYSGQSQPLSPNDTSATLTVTAPKNTQYTFVLEEVIGD